MRPLVTVWVQWSASRYESRSLEGRKRKWCSPFPNPLERKYSLKPASFAADSLINCKIHALLDRSVHPSFAKAHAILRRGFPAASGASPSLWSRTAPTLCDDACAFV